jgi:hypothetical protein
MAALRRHHRYSIAALLLPLFWAQAHAACQLRLDVDAASSTLSFAGDNSLKPQNGGAPLTATVSDAEPSTPKGFAGPLFASAPSLATCPTTEVDWVAALGGLSLSSDAALWHAPGVQVYPPVLPGTTAGFPFQPTSITLRMNASLAAKAGGSATAGAFTSNLTMTITQGWLYTKTAFTGERYDDISDLAANISAVDGTLSLQVRFARCAIPPLHYSLFHSSCQATKRLL